MTVMLRKKVSPHRKQIDRLMSGPVMTYNYPVIEDKTDVSQEPQTDADFRIQLAETRTQLAGLEKTVEREFARVGNGLEKLGTGLSDAISGLKSDFVSRAEHMAVVDRLARVEKVQWFIGSAVILAVLTAVLNGAGIIK